MKRILPALMIAACQPGPDEQLDPGANALLGCVEDVHEPNDTLDEALPWVEGTHAISAGADDWWSFDIAPGETLELQASFERLDGWGGLELYDVEGNMLDATVNDPYTSRLVWLNSGELPLQVVARATVYEGTCDRYRLDWFTWAADCPVEGAGKHAAVDGPERAAPANGGQDEVVQLDRPDWWSIDQPPKTVTGVTVRQAFPSAQLELELYDGIGEPLATGGLEGAVVNASDAHAQATARVSIDNSTNRGVCASYELRTRTASATCLRDPMPDDSISDARTVAPGAMDASVELWEPDWYRVVVPPDHRLWVEAENDPLLGRVWMQIFDDEPAHVATVQVPPLALNAANRSAEPAAYYVHVMTVEQPLACVPYSVEMGLQTCDKEDALEPNDNADQALPLPDGTTLTVKESDPDVFAVGIVKPGELVSIDASFRESLGRVELALLDRDGVPFYTNASGPWGLEQVRWRNTTDQSFPVFVRATLAPVYADCAQDYVLTGGITP